MSNLFTITIPDSPAALLVTYGAGALIRVQSSPTEGGAFGDIPNPTQPIVTGVITYPVYDADGLPNDWYKFRFEAADGDPVGSYSAATQPVPESTVYASLATFKNYIRTESDDEDELLGLALASASRLIDIATNRSFGVTGSAEARYFMAIDGVVKIDDLMTASGVTVFYDGLRDQSYSTEVDTDNFHLEPVGSLTVGRPYTSIVATSGLPDGLAKVTAAWGWTSIPEIIQNACLLQASRIWARRNSPYGVAGSPEMGNEMRLLARLDPDVELLLSSYRNWWGAA